MRIAVKYHKRISLLLKLTNNLLLMIIFDINNKIIWSYLFIFILFNLFVIIYFDSAFSKDLLIQIDA